MKRLKSAYEIAMERVNKIDKKLTAEEKRMEQREKLKPLLVKFYQGKLNAEGLWQSLREENDPELLKETQFMLLESLGLRTLPEHFKQRKEGILAIETLKQEQNNSLVEQYLNKLNSLQEEYKNERERIEEQVKKEMEENSHMQMRPVQTQDGKNVMKLESVLDAEVKKRISKIISQLEERTNEQFSKWLEELKKNL